MVDRLQRKIVNRQQLLDRVRRASGTVVQCHGCFDIVHPGHIRYLEFARRQGDLLIVTLTGDSDVDKGAQSPHIPQELRAESLAALECVDLVCIDPHPTAEHILNDVKPDVYVKGREYEQSNDPRFLRERRVVEQHGGRVIFSSGEVVFSSTSLINALPENDAGERRRLAAIAQRNAVSRVSLSDTIDGFADQRVLIIGDTVIDRYVFCDPIDVASEAPVMSLNRLDEQRYIGGAAIVAKHIAAMGGQPFLLTAVANDPLSTEVEDALHDAGVQTHLLRCRPALVEKIRYLVGENKLLKVESAQHVPLDSVAQRRAADVIDAQASVADAAVFCDFGYGMIAGPLLRHASETLRPRVRTLAADVSGPRANLLHFRDADLLCPTERELRANLNDFDRGLSSAAYDLLAHTHARHLFVTLQKKGLVIFDRPCHDPHSPEWGGRLHTEHLPTFNDRPLDCLGGGDAMLAAATLALTSGASLMHAAFLGSAAAALEIARLGNVPIPVDDLRHWVNQRTELAPPQPERVIEPAPALAP